MKIPIPASAVRTQLDRILVSEPFTRSRRMQRFLKFIVEETLAGSEHSLGEYSIGLAVFDRGTDFEPALDPIVRNDARRLRLKLHEYYRQAESSPVDKVLIEIPKGGYVPTFRPFAPRPEPIAASVEVRSPRLAVLAFEDLSPTQNRANMMRSFALSVTAHLTDLEGVETIAHTCVPERPVPDVVSELRLSHLVHGSLVEYGRRARLIVSLVQVAGSAQLWADEFDIESAQTAGLPFEITRTVVQAVRARLGVRRLEPALLHSPRSLTAELRTV